MSKEMTEGQKLAEQLLYTRPHAAEAGEELNRAADEFCEGYKTFLDNGKTERDVTAYTVKLLEENGYVPFVPGTNYAPGAKVYLNNRGKSVIAATMGQKPLGEGVHMNIAHTDAPRLDLKPNPLYENSELALLKTHYYGGIRKYQWVAMPLALHGVVYKADGAQVSVCIGEDEGDPVFCITDLLPHLGAEQNERKLGEGVKGEELNIVVGSLPYADKEVKDRVKLLALKLLNDKYGITERDFITAELEAVPAFKAKDVGLDRGLIGAYGHDDRVDAYPALIAEIETKLPVYTTVCVLTDKEEIGSEGVTGLNSMYVFHFVQQLCKAQGADDILCFQNSKCLSADVTAAFDPTFPSAFEAQNSTFVGKGVAISKYTGSRGKGGANDASAELVSYFTRIFDAAGAVWQIGELGKVDQGGGGTVAKYVASHNIDTMDVGVPVLSMHSPFELVAKIDVYMAYKAFKAFNDSAE